MQFELFFPDVYPMEPPKIRLLHPSVSPAGSFWVQSAGALCLEMLTINGWSPAIKLEELILTLRSMMVNCTSGDVVDRTVGSDVSTAVVGAAADAASGLTAWLGSLSGGSKGPEIQNTIQESSTGDD